MAGRPYVLGETNWKEIENAKIDVAILPWGATEAHNYHLPYATDFFEAQYVSNESARKAWERGTKVVSMPAIPFGVNTGQYDIPFCINMNPSTQAAIIRDVAESLSRQGIPKLMIINSHGGNNFNQMIREIQADYESPFICACNWYRILDDQKYFDEPGDHAGEMETSVMMHIQPELVLPLSDAGDGSEKKAKIEGFRDRWVWSPRQWTQVSEDTGIGDPKASTLEKGVRYLDDVTSKIGDFLVDFASMDPNDMYE